jgi:hypothetical protein
MSLQDGPWSCREGAPRLRRRVRARTLILRGLLLGATAVMPSAGHVQAEPPPSDLRKEMVLHVAVEGGYDTPLGRAGLAVEINPLSKLTLAVGLGLNPSTPPPSGRYDLQLALSSRYRFWSIGAASLSAGLGLSIGNRPFQREGFATEGVGRGWYNAIRLNPEISVEYRFRRRWTVRGFGGLGIVLTDARCDSATAFHVSCLSPEIPAPYRYETVPLLPYGGVGIAASTQKESPSVGPTWYGWQILLVDVASAAAILSGSNSSYASTAEHVFLFGGVTLYALDGPTVHVAHRNLGRAVLSFALRALPALVAYQVAPGSDEGGTDHRGTFITMAAATIIDGTVLAWSDPVQTPLR